MTDSDSDTYIQLAVEAFHSSPLSRCSRRASSRDLRSSHIPIPHRKVIIHVLVSVLHGSSPYQDCLIHTMPLGSLTHSLTHSLVLFMIQNLRYPRPPIPFESL